MMMYTQPRKWRALCPDGRVRVAVEVREPDVWFAANARVQVRGRTVTGSVGAFSDAIDREWAEAHPEEVPADRVTGERTVWEFHPYTYLTNGNVFDEQTGAV